MSQDLEWMQKVENFAANAAIQAGCFLYDIEFVGAAGARTLRVYIDKNIEGGAALEDCSNVSKSLNLFLDADENLIPGGTYYLEVSTPGLERQLKKPWHFEKSVGKKIYLKATKSFETLGVDDKKWKNAKTIEEVLTSSNDQEVIFNINNVEIKIPYQFIDKAKVVFDMKKGTKK